MRPSVGYVDAHGRAFVVDFDSVALWARDHERRCAWLERRAGVAHMRRDAELRLIWRRIRAQLELSNRRMTEAFAAVRPAARSAAAAFATLGELIRASREI